MKRAMYSCLVLLAFVLVLVCALSPEAEAATVASGTCGENVTYTLSDGGVLTISGTGAMTDWTSSSEVPWYSNCSNIKTIVIEKGVTSIGSSAFSSCDSLTSVTIPDSVISIGSSAFSYCRHLTSITIPDSVTSIGPFAFSWCISLTSINIGDSVTTIGLSAFSRCSMTSISIPNSVTSIGFSAFRYCTSLTSITIGSSVTSIGESAFCDCTSLISVTIPDSVTTIGSSTFSGCSSLTSITIPDSVTSIEAYAFSNCDSLNHVAFTGTQSQWNSISIGYANTNLDNATLHYETRFPNVDNCVETSVYCPVCQHYITRTAKEGGAHSYADITDTTCSACDHIRSLTAFFVERLPDKLGYIVFEENLDITGGQLLLTYDDGKSGTVPMTLDMVSGFDNTVIGIQTLNVTYEGKTVTFTVEIYATMPERLEVATLPQKLSYAINEQLDLTGLTLTAWYKDDQQTTVSASDVTAQVDMTTAGKKPVTVTFRRISTTFEIYVHDRSLQVVDSSLYPQSNHDYSNSMNETKTLTVPGATQLILTFNSSSATESNYDYVYVLDGNDNQIAKYTGSFAGTVVTVPGDTVKIKLTSDSSQVKYGYAFSKIEADMGMQHPAVTVPGYAATCSKTGLTDGAICEICGEILTPQQELPLASHTWTDATCTAPMTCTVCGATEGDPLGHIGRWITLIAPTETASGIEARICERCGVTETAPILPEIHTWSAWVTVKQPTCEAEGEQIRFCSCGARETQPLPAEHSYDNGLCTDCGRLESYVWTLTGDVTADLTLTEDLYIDLNGYDLSGVITTNGYAVYGMDSTTDGYTCANVGIFSCVDENGQAIVPVRQFKSDITGSVKRYMAIETEDGYTFHRFYLGITKVSLRTGDTGFGYKAVFYGDEQVLSQIDSFGFNLNLEGRDVEVLRSLPVSKLEMGREYSLSLKNFDIANYGEVDVNAEVFLNLKDGETVTSSSVSCSMKTMLQRVCRILANFTDGQIQALKTMCQPYVDFMKNWGIDAILNDE